jgi:iron complex outermembrane receptor protein
MLAEHTLTAITAWRYQDFDIKNGGNFDQFYIGNSGQQLFNNQFTQELRLASTPGSDKKLDYQVGLFYLDARVRSDDPTYYGPDAGAWNASTANYNTLVATAAGRNLLRASLDGMYQSLVTDARVNSLALYGQTDWHISERSTATLGLRVTAEKKTNSISQELDRPGIALTAPNFVGATPAELAAASNVRAGQIKTPFGTIEGTPIDATLLAWNTGLSHKVSDDLLLYTSAGVGVKSGIVNWASTTLVGGTLTPSNLSPEKSFDLELGVKSLLLDKKLLLNVNAYQTQVTDYQAQVNVADASSTTGFSNIWTNAPGVVSRGIEVEAAYQASRALALTATGAVNRSTYDGQFLVATPDVPSGSYIDLNGRQLFGAPEVTLNLGLNYQVPVAGFLGRVTLADSYRSGSYLAVNQSENAWQGGYNVVNLGLGLGSLNKKWELALNVNNLLDTVYASSKATYTSTTASSLQIGAPRYVGVTLKSSL